MRHGIGEDGKVVAVIGDGALTGGVAFEALHNAGGLQTPIVIVLNDNGMSISPNVGALSRSFQRLRANPRLYHAREDVEDAADEAAARARPPDRAARAGDQVGDQGLRGARACCSRSSTSPTWARSTATTSTALRANLEAALAADRPVVVHIHTVKGKGFEPAEEGGLEGMEKWHAAKPGSIVERQARAEEAAAKAPLTRGEMVEGAPARGGREAAARLHRRVRRRARRRGQARQAGDRDHRRDGGGTGLTELEKECPSSTTTSASPSRTPSSSPPGSRSRARSPSARSTRPSCSAPTTRSSTTSACRSSTSSSRWTAPASSATTARPTTAPSTSPTSARCRTSS